MLAFSSSWSGYGDELAWAAAWLAKATGESGYLDTARELFDEAGLCSWVPTGFDWDEKTVGVYVLMYELTGEARFKSCIDDWVNYILNEARYTPQGMIFIDQWGTLRHAASAEIMSRFCKCSERVECEWRTQKRRGCGGGEIPL